MAGGAACLQVCHYLVPCLLPALMAAACLQRCEAALSFAMRRTLCQVAPRLVVRWVHVGEGGEGGGSDGARGWGARELRV